MSTETYPETLDLRVDSMAQGGDAVGRWEGRVVFVAGALPGELVRVQIRERRSAFARGIATEIIEAAPERVAPRIAEGGHAPWQHIDYPAQLRFKEQIVREQLAKLAGLSDAPVLASIPAARPWGYRNTAHFHAHGELLGYYAPDSRTVIDLPQDPLLLPLLNEVLGTLRAAMQQHTVPTNERDRQQQGALLEGVTLRASESHGYAIAALEGKSGLWPLALRWLAQTPALADVQVITPESTSASVHMHEELGDVVFALSLDSFFQTHTAQAARMLELVREGLALQPGERLLDAYGGVGTFGLPLAGGLREVVVIEESPAAVADGRQTAELNLLFNASFMQGPVERVLPALNDTFDAAVLDPPRRGCHPAALAALALLAPRRIAYISCHPGILARDLGPLLNAGYHLRSVQPVDLFPQTPHIECVVMLER